MTTLLSDCRLAGRQLRKSPGFTAVALLTLGLGIGANTAIFSIINAVFMHNLPVADIDRLVAVYTTDDLNVVGGVSRLVVSYPNFEDLRDDNTMFSGMTAIGGASLVLTDGVAAEPVPGQMVTANYFDVLGVKPILGRGFQPGEDRPGTGQALAVISHSLWTRRFGADPALIGRTIGLNSQPFTVIGVAPPGFKGTFSLAQPDAIWVTTSVNHLVLTGLARQIFTLRRGIMFTVIGRLKPEVTLEQASAEMRAIAERLARDFPRDNGGRSVTLVPLSEAAVGINQRGQFVQAGQLLMGVSSFVLLIACVNLANLLLARGAGRSRELAVRAAIGAGRGRLMRQLLTEGLVLAFMGGVVGVVIAYWAQDLLWAFRPPFLPANALELSFDVRVLAFTAVVVVVTGLLFGALPAVRAARPDVNDVLKLAGRQGAASGRGAARIRHALVVAEVALAMIALASAGLFIRSLQEAQQIDPGFESKRLLVLNFNLETAGYSPERGRSFHEDVISRVSSMPGIAGAAVAASYPLGGAQVRSIFTDLQPAGDRGVFITTASVTPDYFGVMQIPLRRGRVLTAADREGTLPVGVISEAFARRFFPDMDPIGHRIKFFNDDVWREVVGVVADVAVAQLGEEPRPFLYLPMHQYYVPAATLHVRTSGDPEPMISSVVQEVQRLEAALAITFPNTIQGIFDQTLWAPRTGAALLGVFGVLALGLAVIGAYGVMAYTVGQRTQEIGLCMALGATPSDVHRMVLRQGAWLTVAGIGLGLIGTVALSRAFASLLYVSSPFDATALVLVTVVLGLTMFLASVIPSRRAMRVDPLVALRDE